MPVDMVHIHHEGGGAPCTAAQCDRFSHGGYCYGIGTDTFARWRSPSENYATADWNHRDWTPCFSGDRHTGYDVTDHDLAVLHDAFMDAYHRGEVTANPQVVAHRNAGGSNATACPGDKAMARWNDIANACRASGAPSPTPPPTPQPEEALLTTIALPPSSATPKGRIPTARAVPAVGTVQLDNGARIQGDTGTSDPATRVWVPGAPHGWRLVDIVDLRPVSGEKAIAALYDPGNGVMNTYKGMIVG